MVEDDSTEPPFHTDTDHREFVSAGAAAGLAVTSAWQLCISDCKAPPTYTHILGNASLLRTHILEMHLT